MTELGWLTKFNIVGSDDITCAKDLRYFNRAVSKLL